MRIFAIALLLSLSACSDPQSPQVAQTTPPQVTAAPSHNAYLDDRSNTQQVIKSYFNAINRKEYARAWSYWTQGSSVQPYATFKQGFANTKETRVTFGLASSEGAAGSIYGVQRLALSVANEDGTHDDFAGCYTTHLSQPAVQDQVPFTPMGIHEAKMTKVVNEAAAQALLTQPCANP